MRNPVNLAHRFADLWRAEDNLSIEHRDKLNTFEIFQQMGATPMQSGAAR